MRAAETSQTVSEVIEDAVREALRPAPVDARGISPLPVYGGSGVLPGVDLSDRGALLEVMDADASADALR